MEVKKELIDPLIEKAGEYGKTSFELLKLKFIAKLSVIMSAWVSGLFIFTILTFFTLMLNIGIALWLGELLGKNYYGFMAIAAFYGLLGIVLYLLHPAIKSRINNLILSQILNADTIKEPNASKD